MNLNYVMVYKGGHEPRRPRLVAQTSTATDVNCDCNTPNRKERRNIWLPSRRVAVRLVAWTHSVLLDEMRMTMEPSGAYRFISIKLNCTFALAKASSS